MRNILLIIALTLGLNATECKLNFDLFKMENKISKMNIRLLKEAMKYRDVHMTREVGAKLLYNYTTGLEYLNKLDKCKISLTAEKIKVLKDLMRLQIQQIKHLIKDQRGLK